MATCLLLSPVPAWSQSVPVAGQLGGWLLLAVVALGLISFLAFRRRCRGITAGSLRERIQRLDPAAAQISEPVFLLDATTLRMAECNTAFKRLIGLGDNICDHQRIRDLEVLRDDQAIHLHAAALRQKGDDHFLTRWRTEDGREIEVELQVRLVELDGVPFFLGTAHDLTWLQHQGASLEQVSDAARQGLGGPLPSH